MNRYTNYTSTVHNRSPRPGGSGCGPMLILLVVIALLGLLLLVDQNPDVPVRILH